MFGKKIKKLKCDICKLEDIQSLTETYSDLKEKYDKLIEYLKLKEKYEVKEVFWGRGFYNEKIFLGYEPIKKCTKCKKEL